jgi:hypothetical protein
VIVVGLACLAVVLLASWALRSGRSPSGTTRAPALVDDRSVLLTNAALTGSCASVRSCLSSFPEMAGTRFETEAWKILGERSNAELGRAEQALDGGDMRAARIALGNAERACGDVTRLARVRRGIAAAESGPPRAWPGGSAPAPTVSLEALGPSDMATPSGAVDARASDSSTTTPIDANPALPIAPVPPPVVDPTLLPPAVVRSEVAVPQSSPSAPVGGAGASSTGGTPPGGGSRATPEGHVVLVPPVASPVTPPVAPPDVTTDLAALCQAHLDLAIERAAALQVRDAEEALGHATDIALALEAPPSARRATAAISCAKAFAAARADGSVHGWAAFLRGGPALEPLAGRGRTELGRAIAAAVQASVRLHSDVPWSREDLDAILGFLRLGRELSAVGDWVALERQIREVPRPGPAPVRALAAAERHVEALELARRWAEASRLREADLWVAALQREVRPGEATAAATLRSLTLGTDATAEVAKRIVAIADRESAAMQRCWACRYPLRADEPTCEHCLWPRDRINEMRLGGSGAGSAQFDWTNDRSRGPTLTVSTHLRSTQSAEHVFTSAPGGLRWSTGAGPAVELPAWTAPTALDVVMGRMPARGRLVHPSPPLPVLPWADIGLFETDLDDLGRVVQMRRIGSEESYDIRWGRLGLLEIRQTRGGPFVRSLVYSEEGRLTDERVTMTSGQKLVSRRLVHDREHSRLARSELDTPEFGNIEVTYR